MARPTRRRPQRGRSPRRPVDWVTDFQTYNLDAGPVILPPNSVDSWRLFTNLDVTNPDALDALGFSRPQFARTVERVRGFVHCWILPDTSWWNTLTGMCYVKFRLEVVQAPPTMTGLSNPQPFTPYIGPEGLFTPSGGNAGFLWEKTFTFLAESAWGSLVIDPALYIQREEVDVRVRRRIEPNEVLVMTTSTIGRTYAGAELEFPDVVADFELRTLVS